MTDPLYPEWDEAARREGDRLRDEAMHRAEQNAPLSFRAGVMLALHYIATYRRELTTDPVWYVLEDWGEPKPPEPRALGPIMKSAVAWGWIVPTEKTWRSVRPDCHRRWLRVYASLLYGRIPVS